jgi:hypothetical protein
VRDLEVVQVEKWFVSGQRLQLCHPVFDSTIAPVSAIPDGLGSLDDWAYQRGNQFLSLEMAQPKAMP